MEESGIEEVVEGKEGSSRVTEGLGKGVAPQDTMDSVSGLLRDRVRDDIGDLCTRPPLRACTPSAVLL